MSDMVYWVYGGVDGIDEGDKWRNQRATRRFYGGRRLALARVPKFLAVLHAIMGMDLPFTCDIAGYQTLQACSFHPPSLTISLGSCDHICDP